MLRISGKSDVPSTAPALPWSQYDFSFLNDLDSATARAYRGDLHALVQWCEGQGFPRIDRWSADHAYCWLVALRERGAKSSTIRRKATAYRAFLNSRGASASADVLTIADLREAQIRAAQVRADVVTVLVVSDDAVLAAGLRLLLSSTGLGCLASTTAQAHEIACDLWDYVLFCPITPGSTDRFTSLDMLPALTARMPQATIVSIGMTGYDPVRTLRLAEAGVQFVIPYEALVQGLAKLIEAMRVGSLPRVHQLPTVLALREAGGLRLDGSVSRFLERARAVPVEVWTANLRLEELPVNRSTVQRLRYAAGELAGLPPPDYARYSAAIRAVPRYPEWPTVRAFVRSCWGLNPSGEYHIEPFNTRACWCLLGHS